MSLPGPAWMEGQSPLQPLLGRSQIWPQCFRYHVQTVIVFSHLLSPCSGSGPSSPQTLFRVLPHLSPCSGSFLTSVRVQGPFPPPQSLFRSFLSPCSGPSSVPVRVLSHLLSPCSGPFPSPQSLSGPSPTSLVIVRVLPHLLSPFSGPFPPPQSLFGSFPASSVPVRSFPTPH